MGITRRTMLLSGAAGVAPFHGLPTRGGLSLAHASEADVDELFERLERNIERFREATMPEGVRAFFEQRGLPGDTLHALFAGLLTTSLVRDLPEELQAEEAVQVRLRRRLVDVGRAALDLRELMKGYDEAARLEVGRRVREDPELVADLQRAMNPWFGGQGVEPEREGQVAQALERTCWELANGDPVAVFDEEIGKIDRFERMAARLEARQESGLEAFDVSEDAGVDCGDAVNRIRTQQDYPPEGVSKREHRRALQIRAQQACELPGGGYDERYKPYLNRWRARKCGVVGAALTGLGVVTLPVLVGICILTPAVVLLVTALVLLGVSNAQMPVGEAG